MAKKQLTWFFCNYNVGSYRSEDNYIFDNGLAFGLPEGAMSEQAVVGVFVLVNKEKTPLPEKRLQG